MTLDEFKATLEDDRPPRHVSPALAALWHDGTGNWDAAHAVAQDIADATGAWVHAYLHRKEGDESNAGYWYRQADRPHSRLSLAEEWDEIAEALLER